MVTFVRPIAIYIWGLLKTTLFVLVPIGVLNIAIYILIGNITPSNQYGGFQLNQIFPLAICFVNVAGIFAWSESKNPKIAMLILAIGFVVALMCGGSSYDLATATMTDTNAQVFGLGVAALIFASHFGIILISSPNKDF